MTTDWERYRDLFFFEESLGLSVDPSRMGLDEGFLERMAPEMARAFRAMDDLEAGAIANPDEGRRVGHYWLRAPERAPDPELRRAIEETRARVLEFARTVHTGEVRPPEAERFDALLVVGIGGSALGPQLVADALGDPSRDRLAPHFLDNTDPAGVDRTLRSLGDRLARTLVVVISKSGSTPETRNGMLETRSAFERAGLDFPKQAVAITGEGSKLDALAEKEGWLARFAMWDWVGGRTSETSAVGLLPAALQGVDVERLLEGAARCDEITRRHDVRTNPAAQLALGWYHATNGRGEKDMVILPYKDSLLLFSRYLQQLVMESLGKERDLEGNVVHQGLTVYGNKGSTDQHAYVQQLREGVANFFVTFVEVLEEGGQRQDGGHRHGVEVEPGVTSGDYLRGFLLGTREALSEAGRPSTTLTIERVDAFHLGVLIALYERAVGLYASLIGINAYHQPGVEAGKKAASAVLALQQEVMASLREATEPKTAEELSKDLGKPERAETVFLLLRGIAANGRGVRREGSAHPTEARFSWTG